MNTQVKRKVTAAAVAAGLALAVLVPASAEAYTRNFYYQGMQAPNSTRTSGFHYQNRTRVFAGSSFLVQAVTAEYTSNGVFYASAEALGSDAKITHPDKIYGYAQCYFRYPSGGSGSTYIQCGYLT